jgi:hypothetical protein
MKEMFQMSLYTQLPSYFFDDYDFGIKSGCVPKFNFIPKIDTSFEFGWDDASDADITYLHRNLAAALRIPIRYFDSVPHDLENDPYDAFH